MRPLPVSLSLLAVLAACVGEDATRDPPVRPSARLAPADDGDASGWIARAATSRELFADWRGVAAIWLAPDGRSVAWLEEDTEQELYCTVYQLRVAPIGADGVVDRARATLLDSLLPSHARAAWSAAGELAWSASRTVFEPHQLEVFTHAPGGRPRRLVQFPDNRHLYASAPAWSPDGSRIALVAQLEATEQLLVVDRGGAVVTRIGLGGGSYSHFPSVSWSPDGRWLALDQESGAALFDVGAGTLHRLAVRDAPETESAWTPPQWSADGARVAFACQCAVAVASVPSLAVTKFAPMAPRLAILAADARQERAGEFVAAAWVPGTDRLFVVERRHEADGGRDFLRLLAGEDCFEPGRTRWFGLVAAPCDPEARAPVVLFQDPVIQLVEPPSASRRSPWRVRPWTTRLLPQLVR